MTTTTTGSTDTSSYPAARASLPAVAFDPPPLTEYEENHLVAEDAP
jgi:hypothetical protein